MPTRILILGNKEIASKCFSYLIEQSSNQNIEICQYIYDKEQEHTNTVLIEKCKSNNIPISVTAEDILSHEFDYLISVNYFTILNKRQIDKARKMAINLHLAPLPEYRGCNQFSYAIINGDQHFGVTIHEMDEGVDTGDILFENRFAIPENVYVDELYSLTVDAGFNLFQQSINSILEGNFTKKKQISFESRKTSFHLRNEIQSLKELKLNWSEEKIQRHIRATLMPGFEPPFFIINGEKLYVSKNWK